MDTAQGTLVARLTTGPVPARGAKVWLTPESERLHLFDAQSGELLAATHSGASPPVEVKS